MSDVTVRPLRRGYSTVPAVHVHGDPTSDGYDSTNVHGLDTELDACGVTLRLRELLA